MLPVSSSIRGGVHDLLIFFIQFCPRTEGIFVISNNPVGSVPHPLAVRVL